MATQSVVSKPTALVFLLFIVTQAMVLGSPTSQGIDEAHCLKAASAAAARTPVAETGESKEKAEEKQEAGKEEGSGGPEKDAEKSVDADEKPGDSKGKKPAAGWHGSIDIEDLDDLTTETESGSESDEDYFFSSDDDEDDENEEKDDDGDDDDNGSNENEGNGNKRRKIAGVPDLNVPIEIESSESEN